MGNAGAQRHKCGLEGGGFPLKWEVYTSEWVRNEAFLTASCCEAAGLMKDLQFSPRLIISQSHFSLINYYRFYYIST